MRRSSSKQPAEAGPRDAYSGSGARTPTLLSYPSTVWCKKGLSPSGSSTSAESDGGAGDGAPRKRVLILFVPGNPGLIEYYVPFLTHLRRLLDETESRRRRGGGGGGLVDVEFEMHGTSLAGFDDADHEAPFRMPDNPPRVVEDQIRLVEGRVAELLRRSSEEGNRVDHVVLIGHSVGTYISCEVFHRESLRRHERRAQLKGESPTMTSQLPQSPPSQQQQQLPPLHLTAGILLFPTISHLALSPSGRRLDLVRRWALLDRYAHVAAALFLRLWPRRLLGFFLSSVLRMSPHGVEATARWLKSRDGVWQALHMGKDEMAVIAAERWGEGMWDDVVREGAADDDDVEDEDGGKPRFFLLYGKDDHWVANHVRDEFIAARGKVAGGATGRTKVVIDEGGVLPHDFCIHHSEAVAEKVNVWIDQLVEGLTAAQPVPS